MRIKYDLKIRNKLISGWVMEMVFKLKRKDEII
jgi:hypothetical protein